MMQLAPLFVILAATLWGIDLIVLRPSLYTLPVPLVVMLETAIATTIMTPFFVRRLPALRTLRRNDWLAICAIAILGGAMGTMFITKALFYVHFVNLSIVALIQKLQPVFAITLAALLLKERPPRAFFPWAVLALVGAYLMTFGWRIPNLETGDKTAVAALFALVAAFSFGSSTVFGKRALQSVGFETLTFLRFAMTVVVMLVLTTLTGSWEGLSVTTGKQFRILLLIAFTTGAPAIFLYYYGLRRITASVATICELAFPLTAILLEYLLRGKLLGGVQWLGVIILFASILRVTTLQSRSSA